MLMYFSDKDKAGEFTDYPFGDGTFNFCVFEKHLSLNEVDIGHDSSWRTGCLKMNLAASSNIYGNSATVQPASLMVQYLIKY